MAEEKKLTNETSILKPEDIAKIKVMADEKEQEKNKKKKKGLFGFLRKNK